MYIEVFVLLLLAVVSSYCGEPPFMPMVPAGGIDMYGEGMYGGGMGHGGRGGMGGMGYFGSSMHNFYPTGGYQYSQIGYDPNWNTYATGGGVFGEFSDPVWNQAQYPWNYNTYNYNNWYPSNNNWGGQGGSNWDSWNGNNWNNNNWNNNNFDGGWNQDTWTNGGSTGTDNWNQDNGLGLQSH
ncbi:hypothetical protein ACF0H5_016099 [Mactra antiquata]